MNAHVPYVPYISYVFHKKHLTYALKYSIYTIQGGYMRIMVLKEVFHKFKNGEKLCLQQVIYNDGGEPLVSYRFIRRDAKGNMKAQRGQAAIPDLKIAQKLIEQIQKIAIRGKINVG